MITNFSQASLLFNSPIIIKTDNDETFVFNMPTLQDEVSSVIDYDFFYGFCTASYEDLKKKLQIEFSSKYDFLMKAIKKGSEIGLSLLTCLKKHIQDFQYVDDSFISNGFTITEEILDTFCLYLSIATGCSEWNALEQRQKEKAMSPEEREWERRKRENQARINAAKQKAGKGISLEKIIMIVKYEFNMSLQEIYKLNKFGLMLLYKNAMNIASYKISVGQMASGNIPKNFKYEYWADKK